MTGSTDEAATLAERLGESTRSVAERDLRRVSGFLYETLGRWYELQPGGRPPSVEPSNIVVIARPPPQQASDAQVSLLDDGDELEIASAEHIGGSDESDDGSGDELDDEADDDTGDDADDDADDEAGSVADEREGVFAASSTLAQVAIGRCRVDDESWDDLILQLETDQRPALASALWVGLATQPEARYPSIAQWRRSVDAALRSDAATATMLEGDDQRHRTGLLITAAVVLLVIAGGGFLLLNNSDENGSAATSTEPGGPTIGVDETTPTSADLSTTSVTEVSTDDVAEPADVGDDPCALVGPLGPITIDQVTDGAIVVSWPPSSEAVNILLDDGFVDTVPAEAFRYVIEQPPLSDDPLAPDTEYTVGVEPQSGDPSTACTTTLANPVPGSEAIIGVRAPTGLGILDTSSTSITVGWDPRPGADLHNLYLDGTYVRFGDVGGSSTVGDETEFTFLDLEPDTTYDIGIRRVEGPNQSGLVVVTATTDSG